MSDGLDAMTAQRARASSARTLPPPRHPAKKPPAQAKPTGQTDTDAPDAAEPVATRKTLTATVAPDGPDDLVRSSIYIDTTADDFLENVRIAGRRGRPKIDASRSAVVRLALERLSEQLTPVEVLETLRIRGAATTSSTGRPRL